MVARKNPVQPTNCDKRLRKYDTSVQVRRTGVSARRRNPPAAGVMRRSAPRAAVAGAACRDARRRCARTRSSRVCAMPHRSPRGSPLRRPRARGRAHGPPFRLSNLGRGTLAVFRRMRGRGSGSRMSDFRRRIRRRSRRSRRCASGPIEPATRSEPRGRFGCRACAEWFHMHPARVPMGSRWRRDYAAIALRLGIGGRLSPRLERRAAARRACARGFRGIDDSRPRTAENARAECQMPDAGTVGAKARSRRRFDSSAASRNAATASNTRRQRADDGGIASPARSRHPLPLVPRAHEKKPRRHFHRRGQPMSEKFHGGDGNDHIGRPAASQPSISAIQLRRARSHASGRRAYR